MQPYDLPTIDIQCRESDTIRKIPHKKSKGLTFAVWQSVTLAIVAYALTLLRYLGLLSSAVDAVRGFLGV